MRITIEISEKDYNKVYNTSVTVGELYETLQGRIYRAIVNGEPHENHNRCMYFENNGVIPCCTHDCEKCVWYRQKETS